MIYLGTFFLLLFFSIAPLNAMLRHRYSDMTRFCMGIFGVIFCVFCYFTFVVNKHINEASHLNAEILITSSIDVNKVKYETARKEYSSINHTIQEILDKYYPQVIIQDVAKGGLFNYTVGGSSDSSFEGLGDIEKGAGEKLANLNELVDKRHELAKELIAYKEAIYKVEKEEYLQRLYVLKNSFFDGVVITYFLKKSTAEHKKNFYEKTGSKPIHKQN
jgi:hypothetical protein